METSRYQELAVEIILYVLLLCHKNMYWYLWEKSSAAGKLHGFSVGIEIDVVVVWVVEMDVISA